MDDPKAPEVIRVSALDTILELARRHPIEDYAPPIMQTWLRCIGLKALQAKLMELLVIIVQVDISKNNLILKIIKQFDNQFDFFYLYVL